MPTGETLQEISNILIKYIDSIVELDENSKLIAKNIVLKNGNMQTDYITFNTALSTPPTDVGSMYWDDKNKTVAVNMQPSNGTTVSIQVGQELQIRGVNKTGTTTSNGSVVFVSGVQGNRPKFDLASTTTYTNAVKTIAMATEDVPNNAYGYYTKEGTVRDLNTNDYTVGDCIYLGTVSGSFTTITPSFGEARIKVGIITVAHPTQGEIELCISEDKYMFGDVDNGNYSGFEEDGTLVARGDALTWRDEFVAGDYFVPAGASAPDTVNITVGGVSTRKYAFDGVNTAEKLGNSHEIQHDIAVDWVNSGTVSIEQHIHCCASTTASGTATFVTNWALLKVNGAIITGSNVTASVYFDGTQQPYCNKLLGDDLVTPAEGFGIGDLIEFTVTRDPTLASDTFEADVIFYKTALHVPMDMLGSRQRYIK